MKDRMKYYLGLDVGGTNLAAGVVDENGKVIARAQMSSNAGRSIEAITEDMARVSVCAVEKAGLTLADFRSWGIGMPSYVNPRNGLLVHANCFGWKNVPIRQYLENKLSLPIYIENDANCAALGETMAGAAKGYANVVMLTLGTGLGGGIILNHRIFSGADGMGAELGHTKLVYLGEKCSCGQYGCAESYCSATALIRQAKEILAFHRESAILEMVGGDLNKVNAEVVFRAAKERDVTAAGIIERYIDYLSCAISSFIVIFRPELIVLGGGVSNAGDALVEPLKVRLAANTFAAEEIGLPRVCCAKLGDDAGIIGAAMLEREDK